MVALSPTSNGVPFAPILPINDQQFKLGAVNAPSAGFEQSDVGSPAGVDWHVSPVGHSLALAYMRLPEAVIVIVSPAVIGTLVSVYGCVRIMESVSGNVPGDGDTTGVADGDGVAIAIAVGLGAADGDADGVAVGAAAGDGVAVGIADGDGVAARLGDGLGVANGDGVDVAEGMALGIPEAVADADGLADGLADAIGLCDALTAAPGKTGATALELPVPQPEATTKQKNSKRMRSARSIKHYFLGFPLQSRPPCTGPCFNPLAV